MHAMKGASDTIRWQGVRPPIHFAATLSTSSSPADSRGYSAALRPLLCRDGHVRAGLPDLIRFSAVATVLCARISCVQGAQSTQS